MRIQYIPYIWPLITSAFISLSLGIFVILRRRDSKGAVSFILSMLVVTIWSLGNALEMASIDFSTKLFWANVQYFAYCYSPLTLLAMCMEFTGYDRWIRNRKVLWLAVIPTIIVILVWTDHLHGLIRYNMHMNYSGSFPVIDKKYGPAFYIHALYSHMLNILAWILLLKAVFFRNTVYKT
ncbi:MAG TPA: histidine kinase N-terminal 7TM domain-containing protein, partial [Bacillota bacterium]|nr:histidine kinase N-terminal 7TM domain-containing protein [Bacillota bacterium]